MNPRISIREKQTSKNLFYFDIMIDDELYVQKIPGTKDMGDEKEITMGEKLLLILKDTEYRFRKDGRKLVSDQPDGRTLVGDQPE